MSNAIITVEGLSKKYRILHQSEQKASTLREAIPMAAKKLFQRSDPDQLLAKSTSEEFWALKNVSFEVKRGEVLGIIGKNGAGKSTLLKILSRITEPTEGQVRIKGRVASLLEVGTGFHPELTGRENVFLNGAILGMSKVEIRRKFDEIVAFAGVEKFLDTPVKRYSSGMYVRLAFAVAAHLEPEILIIDEVLAVGDAEFQKKCLGKMQDVANKEGRTVLFVSHHLQTVSTITDRCILLESGSVAIEGLPRTTIAGYLSRQKRESLVYEGSKNDSPCVVRLEVQTSEPGNVHTNNRPVKIIADVWVPEPIQSASFAVHIVNNLGQSIVNLWIDDSEMPFGREPGMYRLVCHVPKFRLYMGNYTCKTYLSNSVGRVFFETLEDKCPFQVVMYGQSRQWEWHEHECNYLEDFSWDITPSSGKALDEKAVLE